MIFKDISLSEFSPNPPVDRTIVNRYQKDIPIRLPDDYVEFLTTANGGEGFIGEKSYLILWCIEELLTNNESYRTIEMAAQIFLFGSNGGGEAFAFAQVGSALQLVAIPFIPMDVRDSIVIAPNFECFLRKLSENGIPW